MRIEIYAGANDPPGHRVVVDNHGIVVDLSSLGGPAADPLVYQIIWDDSVNDNGFRGVIRRQTRGSNAIGEQRLGDFSVIQPYLDAYNARKAALA